MTANGDMPPCQPGNGDTPDRVNGDDLDAVDETVAKITDAEVAKNLQRVLNQYALIAGTPEQMRWPEINLRGMCEASTELQTAMTADKVKEMQWRARFLEKQARAAIAAAHDEARKIVSDARDEALEQAAMMIRDAREKAARIISVAKAEAEQIICGADTAAEQIKAERDRREMYMPAPDSCAAHIAGFSRSGSPAAGPPAEDRPASRAPAVFLGLLPAPEDGLDEQRGRNQPGDTVGENVLASLGLTGSLPMMLAIGSCALMPTPSAADLPRQTEDGTWPLGKPSLDPGGRLYPARPRAELAWESEAPNTHRVNRDGMNSYALAVIRRVLARVVNSGIPITSWNLMVGGNANEVTRKARADFLLDEEPLWYVVMSPGHTDVDGEEGQRGITADGHSASADGRPRMPTPRPGCHDADSQAACWDL
jgi:vacuolar-type H+-ATPase subunit H